VARKQTRPCDHLRPPRPIESPRILGAGRGHALVSRSNRRVRNARRRRAAHRVQGAVPLGRSRLGAHARLECPVHRRELIGASPFPRTKAAPRRWTFHTTEGRSLRILDSEAAGELTWNEPAGDLRGTYVFTGTATATRTEKLTLVADPGLPAWLVDDTARVLPDYFASYGVAMGVPLDVSPLVLVSQIAPDARIDAMRGKTMTALIQLEAVGNEWTRSTPTRRRRWAELLAHEAFHLWNGQIARRGDDKLDVWLSEGSAVFMAGLALQRAGLLTPDAYEKRILRSANECIASLGGPLHVELADPIYYACGELVHFLVDRALADRGGATAVWAKLIARGSYTTSDFVDAIDAPLRADVQQILDVGLGTDPAAHVQRLLSDARLPTKRAPHSKQLVRRR
jgi:hypothetical protein